jgi:hypothetical protein
MKNKQQHIAVGQPKLNAGHFRLVSWGTNSIELGP